MRCPFLNEAQVKFCRTSPFRKMILRAPEPGIPERCSSPDYVRCPLANCRPDGTSAPDRCPSLGESLVQYCSAASITKFIPYSESILSRCVKESYRYCDLFLSLAAQLEGGDKSTLSLARKSGIVRDAPPGEQGIDGIQIPRRLKYSSNHMWLDVSRDGCCHVGVDAFLAAVLGSIEKLNFLAVKRLARPTAILTVKGMDLQMVFPNPMLLMRPNSYLRANPDRLLADPYGVGWLFEGEPAMDSTVEQRNLTSGLIPGRSALAWMQQESKRLMAFVREQLARPELQRGALMADGRYLAPGLVQHLEREEALNLFDEFFSPYACWRR